MSLKDTLAPTQRTGRAQMAAHWIPDGAKVLEVGVGSGTFRESVRYRCQYVGTDIVPVDRETRRLNLSRDPMPPEEFDYIVALGAFEYFSDPAVGIDKLCATHSTLIVSYCCCAEEPVAPLVQQAREKRGWASHLSADSFAQLFLRHGLRVAQKEPYNAGREYQQILWLFVNDGLS